jgi:hypothetical protein
MTIELLLNIVYNISFLHMFQFNYHSKNHLLKLRNELHYKQ